MEFWFSDTCFTNKVPPIYIVKVVLENPKSIKKNSRFFFEICIIFNFSDFSSYILVAVSTGNRHSVTEAIAAIPVETGRDWRALVKNNELESLFQFWKHFHHYIQTINFGAWSCMTWLNKRPAMAGNRTRVNCLEGSYAHHYTTNACWESIAKNWTYFSLAVCDILLGNLVRFMATGHYPRHSRVITFARRMWREPRDNRQCLRYRVDRGRRRSGTSIPIWFPFDSRPPHFISWHLISSHLDLATHSLSGGKR